MQSPSLTRNPRHHQIFLPYSLLAQFKTGVTKQMNLRRLVTCHTNILWLIYTARRTNSNEVSKCLFVDVDLFVWPAVRIATAFKISAISTYACFASHAPLCQRMQP